MAGITTYIEINPSNEVSATALESFYAQRESFGDEAAKQTAAVANFKIFNNISELKLQKLYISITSSNSIFYRFKIINSQFEFNWEVFLDEELNDVNYSALHIYDDLGNLRSVHGYTDYTYSVINNTLNALAELEVRPLKGDSTPFYRSK